MYGLDEKSGIAGTLGQAASGAERQAENMPGVPSTGPGGPQWEGGAVMPMAPGPMQSPGKTDQLGAANRSYQAGQDEFTEMADTLGLSGKGGGFDESRSAPTETRHLNPEARQAQRDQADEDRRIAQENATIGTEVMAGNIAEAPSSTVGIDTVPPFAATAEAPEPNAAVNPPKDSPAVEAAFGAPAPPPAPAVTPSPAPAPPAIEPPTSVAASPSTLEPNLK